MDSPSAATEHTAGDVVRRLAAGLERGMAYVTALASESLEVLWISPSVRDLTGWTPDQLIGMSAFELIHPDDLEGVARLMAAEQNDPHPYGSDPARRAVNRIRFRTVDGGWCSLDIAANNQCQNPEVRGFVFILSDTTAQRLMDDIYDAMASGVAIDEIATKVAEMVSWQTDRSFVRVTAAGLAEVEAGVPRPDTEFVRADAGEALLEVEHPRGVPPSEWFMVLLERAAGLLRVAITRHHGELAMRRRLDEKTAIISAVSHDLRSPIAAIQLMSTLLDGDGDALSPDQRRTLTARISADARRTSRLLADLTSVDRLLHGSTEPTKHRVHAGALVERVLADLDLADHPDHLVSFDHHGVEPHLCVDPVLTERIVDNLITNALKHTPAGSRIRVSIEPVAAEAAIHVDDDGSGVPLAERVAVFDAYVRGDGATSRPGSGMGLFIVRTFAEVQGGRVACDESPLGGARFTVLLPLDLP
jgi:PAS domain S-box-containing protein